MTRKLVIDPVTDWKSESGTPFATKRGPQCEVAVAMRGSIGGAGSMMARPDNPHGARIGTMQSFAGTLDNELAGPGKARRPRDREVRPA